VHFILGGAGFLGSAVVRVLQRRGEPYVVITRDNYADYTGQRCDVFINANGNAKKFLAHREPMVDFDASTRSVRTSLEDFDYGTYVYFSSVDVYPDPSKSDSTGEDAPLDVSAQIPYGFHKYLAEQCVRHRAARWLIPRFGAFVGPGLQKNAVFDILAGQPLWVDARSAFQFLSTDDAAEIVFALLDQQVSNQVFNVCGRGQISVEDMLRIVGKHVPVQPGSPVITYDVNISKLKRHLDVPSSYDVVQAYMVGELTSKAPILVGGN
jgi:nucleoside-diphosphate-sugar epimerase